jgi:NAD(P)-dependent dehydrogenase (short-subunit alcohol dehydrogenase family)
VTRRAEKVAGAASAIGDAAALFLLSDKTRFVTGTVLTADGRWTRSLETLRRGQSDEGQPK